MGRQKEFVIQGNIKKSSELSYDDLIFLSDQFYNTNKNITKKDYKSENNLPCIDMVLKILNNQGMSYMDFIDRYKNIKNRKKIYNPELYNVYVNKYKDISNKRSKPLTTKELYANNLPTSQWFIKHCPDPNVNNWADFVQWCGFISSNNCGVKINDKDFVIDKLYMLEKKLGRPIQLRDITRRNIGFSWQVIYDIWGGLEQCKEEIGLKHSVGNTPKPWDYYDEMMTKVLDDIFKATNNREFTWQDFFDYKSIPVSKDGFINACLRQNIDLYTYFENKGFKLINNAGAGYVTRFEDGEVCKSSYERKFSTFLRENNIPYRRNIKYKTLGDNIVNTDIDCDYKINDDIWLEICGMMRATDTDWRTKHFDNKIYHDYQQKMLNKEQILKTANVPYIFLFQEDFDNGEYKRKTLDFLNR